MSGTLAISPWTIRLIVLASGTATMALQMCAVRLLAPWVGGSAIVWATTIGLSLLAMGCGYQLGGRLADRTPDSRLLARTLLGAALLVATIPLAAPQLLPDVHLGIDDATWSSLVGSAVGYGVLFLAPSLLLGITPPFAIRLATPAVAAGGRTAGRLYALSTVGSIVGTLASGLVLVQWIGTRATLWSIAALLALAGVAALRARGHLAVSVASSSPHDHAERDAPPVPGAVAAPSPRDAVAPLALPIAAGILLVEGMATMATEMAVARMVAPFYGASHVVWANLIAIVMGCIALGSWLGGRMADRRPSLGALVVLLGLAAAAVAALPFAAAPVMRVSTGGIDAVALGTVVGSFLATMALIVVPVTLLGMVPPWVLRLALPDVAHAGRTAGALYAVSTAGAIVGTFASVLWLIPAVGTRRTTLLFAGLLAILAMVLVLRGGDRWVGWPGRREGWRARLGRHARELPALLLAGIVLLAAIPVGTVKPVDGGEVLFEQDSRYQFVQVVEDDEGRRLLQLNEGWAVHSVYDPDTVLTGGIWDHFLVLPALLERGAGAVPDCGPTAACATTDPSDARRPARVLVVGNAAGTAARAFAQLRPSADVTGIELDPVVTRVGRDLFAMGDTGVDVETADGRPFLARAREHWDVIHVDAYRQPYIPFYLTTREFFTEAKERLQPGGVLSINVGSTPEDPRINEAVAATMRDVFPLVARYRAETYNEVIVAVADDEVTLDELRGRIRSSDLAVGDAHVFFDRVSRPSDAPSHGELPELADERRALGVVFGDFADGMVEVEPDGSRVLTDDRAPVEWMTDRMIFGATDDQP